MFGRSKVMHIPDASDNVMEAFENHEIDQLVAFCGVPIARGWFFSRGGAARNAPICEPCAELDGGLLWDPDTGQWYWPEEVAGL